MTTETKNLGIKDSGQRRTAITGAVRDVPFGKGRFDLVPYFGILAIAQQMEAGAAKYAARNWEKGMPLSWFLDSAIRHLLKLMAGFDDEPHERGVIWNIATFIETQERIKRGLLPAELDDLPHTFKGQDPDKIIDKIENIAKVLHSSQNITEKDIKRTKELNDEFGWTTYIGEDAPLGVDQLKWHKKQYTHHIRVANGYWYNGYQNRERNEDARILSKRRVDFHDKMANYHAKEIKLLTKKK